jgi:phosphate uptake regulator
MLESSVIRIIKKRLSIISALRKLPAATAELASMAAGLPQRLDRMMKTAERGEIQVRADVSGIEKHIHRLEQLVNKTVICIIGAAIILGLALFFAGVRLGQ